MMKRSSASKTLKVYFLLFLVVFAGRLAYGYYTTPDVVHTRSTRDRVPDIEESFASAKRNYASDRVVKGGAPSAAPGVPAFPAVDQKYEKIATVTSATKSFDHDVRAIREKAREYGAVIQYEQSRGGANRRSRILQLLIGVQPRSFDAFCKAVQAIGRVESIEVVKTDKTNEYLNLRAQRESLQSTLDALNGLKRMNGNVEAFVNLQYRVLEIEQQLQALGVSLGDFDEVNEFCTVRLTLYEDHDIRVNPPDLITRLMIAFKWSVKYYLAMTFALGFFAMFVFFAVATVDKVTGWGQPPSRRSRLRNEEEAQSAEEEEQE